MFDVINVEIGVLEFIIIYVKSLLSGEGICFMLILIVLNLMSF